jgi:hypothetical protein
VSFTLAIYRKKEKIVFLIFDFWAYFAKYGKIWLWVTGQKG